MMGSAIRILGIDPGLRTTGWGAIEVAGSAVAFIGAGSIRSAAEDPLSTRLLALYDGLAAVVETVAAGEAAVEQTFVNRDGAATLKLGQARGIALLVPAKAGLTVAEYAPSVVKKTIVGRGQAEKVQIRAMVKVLLPRASFDSDDAADALAIAICHAHHRNAPLARLARAAAEASA